MSSGLLHAELTATCNALGYFDGSKYFCESHCAETAKDLIRYLRRDGESHEIRLFLGNTNLVKTDLLPIVQCHANNKLLFDIIIRLLTNLTTPALIVYKEKVPKERTERNRFLELVRHLQNYKEAFADTKPWSVIADKLSHYLATVEEGTQDDENERAIERLLILVRNVLHIPAGSDHDSRPDNDASVHDQVLWALHQSGMLDILLYMASSQQETLFFMHVLEIICLMVREQSPSCLAKSAAQRSAEERQEDSHELELLRQRENAAKLEKMRKYRSTRHFGGTFVIKNMKSTSDKDLIYHKPLTNMDNISLDLEKKRVKLPKNKQPLKWLSAERKSALSVRLILKQFCMEILNAAYNPLMKFVKDNIVRGPKQDDDESYYFTAMRFFMEFNRHHKFQVKLVSETLSVETFHFIHKYLEMWHGNMLSDKGRIPIWSSRMHMAVNAYKELLYNLGEMDRSSDEGVRDSSRVLKSNIFYVMEYREMLLVLMNTYKKNQFSIQYLRDLLETAHIFLKLFEMFGKNKKIFVQSKGKKTKKSKKSSGLQGGQEIMEKEELTWPQVATELETVLAGPINAQIIPFDAALDVTMDQQKIEAAKRISHFLKNRQFEEAVALLRGAREVWPENDSFGKIDSTQIEELETLQEIFLADLGEPELTKEDPVEDHMDEYDAEEEEETYMPAIEERSIDVKDFINNFASSKVLYVCGMLLRHYNSNSVHINHCIAKMMHRVAVDCKMPSMLFQATLFRSFQRLFAETNQKYKELVKLGIFIIRKFTEVAATNKKLLAEILFWKSSKQAYEIEMGYGSFQEAHKSRSSQYIWEEHEEDELRRLYVEFKRDFPEGTNLMSWIRTNLIKERTERAIKKKLIEMHLIQPEPKMKKHQWSEEEETKLRDLYEEFANDEDPMKMLLLGFPDRSKHVIKKVLLRIGAISDPKELRKKRKPKSTGSKKQSKTGPVYDSPESDVSSNSESEGEDDRNAERMRQRSLIVRPGLGSAVKNVLVASANTAATMYISGGLEWVCEGLRDTAEDAKDGDFEEVPLVPLGESPARSLSDKTFTSFMLAIGCHPPVSGQEAYWRMSSEWREDDFKIRINLVEAMFKACESNEEDISEEINDIIKSFGEDVGLDESRRTEHNSDADEDDEYRNMTAKAGSLGTRRRFDSSSSVEGDPIQSWREQSPAYDELSQTGNATSKIRSQKRRDSGSSESDAPLPLWRERSPAFSETSNVSKVKGQNHQSNKSPTSSHGSASQSSKHSSRRDSSVASTPSSRKSKTSYKSAASSSVTSTPSSKSTIRPTRSPHSRTSSPESSVASTPSNRKSKTSSTPSSKSTFRSTRSPHSRTSSPESSIASTPSSRKSNMSRKSALSSSISSTPSKRSHRQTSPSPSITSSCISTPGSKQLNTSIDTNDTTLRPLSDNESKNNKENKKAPKKRTVDSSDEDNYGNDLNNEYADGDVGKALNKRNHSYNLSDSDGEAKSPLLKKKKRIVIVSDDDD